jgi:hypothetical protein
MKTNSMAHNSSDANSRSASQEIPPPSLAFIEPEGSLPCSQEPTTGPHPEPDESSPYLSTPIL